MDTFYQLGDMMSHTWLESWILHTIFLWVTSSLSQLSKRYQFSNPAGYAKTLYGLGGTDLHCKKQKKKFYIANDDHNILADVSCTCILQQTY